jgi:hypothetical protein
VGQEFRIREFGFSVAQEDVPPPIPLQMADILAYSCIQPNDCFGVMDELTSLDKRTADDILQPLCAIDLAPSLIKEIWHPIARIEATHRKQARLGRRALEVADRLSGTSSKPLGGEPELEMIRRSVAKLNSLAQTLKIDSRVSLIIHEN